MSKCRDCNGLIVWAKTDKGRMIPMEAVYNDDGSCRIATVDDQGAVAGATANVVIIGTAPTDRGPVPLVRIVARGKGKTLSHWATCPAADQNRRGR